MHSYQALQWSTSVLMLLIVLSCVLPWYTQSVETKETTPSGGNATGTALVLYQMFYRYGSNNCPDASLCTAQQWLLDGPADGMSLWTYDSSLRDTRLVFTCAWLVEMAALLIVPLVFFRMVNLSSVAALVGFIAVGAAVFVFLMLPAALLRDLGEVRPLPPASLSHWRRPHAYSGHPGSACSIAGLCMGGHRAALACATKRRPC